MMKLPHRIAASLLFFSIILLVCLFWNEDWWPFRRKALVRTESLIDFHLWPVRVGKSGTLPNTSQCLFMETAKRAATNINTFLLLDNLDKKRSQNIGGKQPTHIPIHGRSPDEVSWNGHRKLKVILIPHSHSDPGWLKTVTSYFEDQTEPTLNFMLKHLRMYPNMTFVWAESVFLSLWWDKLSPEDRAYARQLAREGRWEVVGGGWVVPDEANPSTYALVDQLIEGHQWLERHLGVKPVNTWTLDPFGYSSTHPYLYRNAGYKNMVVLRVHKDIKQQLTERRQLVYRWRQHWDAAGSTDILTHMMPYKLYNIKHTCGPDTDECLKFDFRAIPGETSESSAQTITDANVAEFAKILLNQYRKKALLYRHDVIMAPIGDDFRYDRDLEWDQQYKNYMKLATYMNAQPGFDVDVRFGTVNDYFRALRERLPLTPPPTLTGDFFPYTDVDEQYWTGYFTSRPYDKFYGRLLEGAIRAAEMLNLVAMVKARRLDRDAETDNLLELSMAHKELGLFQHHDAITGTSRTYVEFDYIQRLQKAHSGVLKKSAASLISGPSGANVVLNMDELRPLRQLEPELPKPLHIKKGGTMVTFFNSQGHEREDLVFLVVDTLHVQVRCNKDVVIPSQTQPLWTGPAHAHRGVYELVFPVKAAALTLVTYTILPGKAASHQPVTVSFQNLGGLVAKVFPFTELRAADDIIHLENKHYRLHFSPRRGTLEQVETLPDRRRVTVGLTFMTYTSSYSGAYIFYPTGRAQDTDLLPRPVIRVVRGHVASEVHVLQNHVTHVVRLPQLSDLHGRAIVVENVANVTRSNNKELIMRLNTNIVTKENYFFTDINGFQVSKRRNFPNLPIQAQYYPMTSLAYLEDPQVRLTLLTASPLGVSCQGRGQLEVMLDRRPQYDDGRGLGEGISDNRLTPSKFYIVIEERSAAQSRTDYATLSSFPSAAVHRQAASLNQPLYALPVVSAMSDVIKTYSLTQNPLPCDMNLVSVRHLNSSQRAPRHAEHLHSAVVLHRHGTDCTVGPPDSSCDVTTELKLRDFFSHAAISSANLTSLSLMYTVRPVDLDEDLHENMAPMSVQTYRLSLR